MPTNRHARGYRRRLGVAQRLDELDEFLVFGPLYDHRPDPDALEHAREYWLLHEAELTAEHIQRQPGTRPDPWWLWTHPHERPLLADQPAVLARLGLLTDDERRALDLAAATHAAAPPRAPHKPRR